MSNKTEKNDFINIFFIDNLKRDFFIMVKEGDKNIEKGGVRQRVMVRAVNFCERHLRGEKNKRAI